MRVLVACEYSGAVRDAFTRAGHDAMSCDLLDTEVPGNHYTGDVRDVLDDGWDLMVCHPPCTDLAVSGNAHMAKKWADGRVDAALDFVRLLLSAPIPRIALENPVAIISSQIRKPSQTIQPWEYGHPEKKATCLWLKNLPPLTPTKIVYDHMMTLPKKEAERVHMLPPSDTRWLERSRTFPGIAAAMADQWGPLGPFDPAVEGDLLDLLALTN